MNVSKDVRDTASSNVFGLSVLFRYRGGAVGCPLKKGRVFIDEAFFAFVLPQETERNFDTCPPLVVRYRRPATMLSPKKSLQDP